MKPQHHMRVQTQMLDSEPHCTHCTLCLSMPPTVPRPQAPPEPREPRLVAPAAQRAVTATVNAAKALEENKALSELLIHVEQEIACLAVKFSKSKQYLHEHFHFTAKSDKKKCQTISMYNVFIHHMSNKENEGQQSMFYV